LSSDFQKKFLEEVDKSFIAFIFSNPAEISGHLSCSAFKKAGDTVILQKKTGENKAKISA